MTVNWKRPAGLLGLALGSLLLCLASALAFAGRRWRKKSAKLEARLLRGRGASPPVALFGAELDSVPEPVKRYLRRILRDGQPVIRDAAFSQRGEFLVKPAEGAWRPFRARQSVSTDPPGFLWDARVRMAPGASVHVRDSFVEGTGGMHASALGLFPMIAVEGTPEIASAALQRYLAEAAWFPTALLPRRGLAWEPLDDSTARATLTVGPTAVSLDFHFDDDGLISGTFSPARARIADGRAIPTPWRGCFADYAERDGMQIPLTAEVEWVLPEGPQPYFRCRITGITFD